jgi:hypothetical protein
MADQLGRLVDLPKRTIVCPLPIVRRPRPSTITFDTSSATVAFLGLVRFAR